MSTQQVIEREDRGEEDGGEEDLGDGMELMTAAELAQALRVSVAWVYTETRAGRIPHIRLRRYVRYRRSTVALWLREREGCAR
jgi:excisionase family DNA binding protein